MNAPLTPEQQESAYLHRLGDRVRAWRTGAGITRKTLAATSGVSERYLAQLEAGQGNISVLLLRKVARAMHVTIEALVREEASDGMAKRHVALVGLRGAGKSTLGEKLAEDSGALFVELDREGVGGLIRMAIEKGRGVKGDLKVGICGEHGGNPPSVAFCHEAGLNYVSCSPYRVPIARLAAAQAALKAKK